MTADWGAQLVRLAQGTLPSENGVTPVTRRNGSSGYVSEMPVVTPVTPVTPSKGSIPKESKFGGVMAGVTIPDEVAERAAIMEIDGCCHHRLAGTPAWLPAGIHPPRSGSNRGSGGPLATLLDEVERRCEDVRP